MDLLLENVLKTNSRVTDARTTIASRVHNKVFLLENPTAALTTKPNHKKHNKRLSSQLLGCKKRPALGTNHKYVFVLDAQLLYILIPSVHAPRIAWHHLLSKHLSVHIAYLQKV